LAIVLPDSILSNPGLAWIRRWILKRCWVLASLDLPTETFEPFTGTQTSILVLQRKTDAEMQQEAAGAPMPDYEVFMAIAHTVGHDRRGNKLYLRTPEGQITEVEDTATIITRHPDGVVTYEPKKIKRPAIDDDLPHIPRLFADWVKERNLLEWYNAR
jgi:type I restriction enzyme M protein